MSFQMWSFHPESHYASGMSLIGYEVRATDGPVGAVHEAAEEIGSTYVVVDTDPWTAGGRLLLPPGTTVRVDRRAERTPVNRTVDGGRERP